MPIEQSFRNASAKINASDICDQYTKSFDTIIITFDGKVLESLLENHRVVALPDVTFGSCHSKYPIYQVIDQPEILFYLCPIGAPTAVGILEEIVYTFTIKNIVMYGSCGVLDKTIARGHIIVPTKAYRDEGTSYHYKAASDFITIVNANKVMAILSNLQIQYVSGYTWTTDGFYRETEPIIQERVEQGCIAVEMEISAVQAFADLRQVNLFTFIYGADNLDAKAWEKRILGNVSGDVRMKHFLLALEIAQSVTTL